MDEEVVIDLFNRAKGLGYSKSIDDFKLLLSTDNQVIDDNFQYVKSQGYGKSIEDFKILIGASPQVATETIEDPLKKKEDTIQEVEEDTVSVSEDGSLVSQDARQIQHRAYGQDTPLKGFGALSLETTTPEEEEKMLQAAREYNASQPEPVDEGFDIEAARRQDQAQAQTEDDFDKVPEGFDISQGNMPSIPVSDRFERERIDLENYKYDSNSAANLRREMFAKEGRDSPETDEAVKDGFISDKELDEYVKRRKEFFKYTDDLVKEGKREKALMYNSIAEAQGLETLTSGEYIALFEGGEEASKEADQKLFKEFSEQVKVNLSKEEIEAIDEKNKELRAKGQQEVPYDFYFNQKRNELFKEYVASKGLLPSQKKERISQAIINADAKILAPSTFGDIFDTTIDLTDALDEETLKEKSEEIAKNKIRRDYIIANIPSEKFVKNAGKALSEEGFIEIFNEANENFFSDFGKQEWETYKKISGNTDPSLIGTEFEDDNEDNSLINQAVVIGDEDATVKNLQAMFPEFRFEGTGRAGEYITIYTLSPNGEVVNSLEVYLEEDNNPVKRIREFMQGAILTKKDKEFLTDKGIENYEDPLWRLDMYEYMLSNPQKFGDANAPSMYRTDRAYETVNFNDIEKYIKQYEDIIPEERLKALKDRMAYADYYYKQQRAQKGSYASAIVAGFGQGLSGFSKMAVNQMANVADLAGVEGAKEAKDGIISAIESMQNQISGTDPESLAERNLLQTVLNTMASSGTAMALGAGNPLATLGAFLTQTSPNIERLLKDEDIPEYQKGLIGFGMGIIESALETYGAQSLLTPASKGIFKQLIIDSIKDLPSDASKELIDLAIRNSVKAKIKSGVLQVGKGMAVEAVTEAQQSQLEDVNKRLLNELYEKQIFDVPDWTTEEGRKQWAEQIIESAKLGALSGGGFATIIHTPVALRNGFRNRSENKKFKNAYELVSNSADVQEAKVKIQNAIDNGVIDKEVGEEYLSEYDEGYAIMSQIPNDLSLNSKREAYVLLREKQQIEKKVAGKDKALEKKNYDRLKEINTALEIIGSRADTKKEEVKTKQQLKEERDAISEQETTPVDEDKQATDVQEVEEGVPTAEPQQTTVEETTTEEVEKAPLTEEQQEVVSLEEDIEGKVTEGRELPGQEVVEETQEVTEEAPVDDRKLVYDEKKTRSKGQQLVIDRAQRAIKAVSKILPDAKIVIHESSKDFKNVTGKDGSGALIDGTIHLNMDKANNRTIAHEVMHAVLIKKLGTESDIRKVTARMLESVKKGLVKGGGKVQITTTETIDGKEVKTTQDVTIEEYLDKFAENYEENMQNEEKVVELAGLLANNYAKLEVKEKGVIKRWIQKVFKPIAAKLGINLNEVTKTDKDIVDFLNVVSRKTTTGDVITDTETEVLTKVKEEAPAVKEKVTKKKPKETTKKVTEEEVKVSEEVTTPIAKPKVVVSGTSDGYQVVSSANTTQAENESIKDARGDKTFDKDGFRITKLEDGSSQVSYKSKVKVSDKGNRPGYAMATVIIPEGIPVNKQQIKEAFDNQLSEIIESNRKKRLGTKFSELTPKQNQQLTDAVVNALSQERVADKVTPVVEAAPTKKKINWTKSEGKRPKRKTQGTELGKLVRQYESGEITIEEYNEQAEKLSPTRMKEKFTEPATEAELGKLRKGKLEKRNAKVEDGVEVGLRIDIPFMEDTGQASVTIHKGKGLSSPAVSYRGSAVIENVEFKSSPSGSLKLASEVTTKNPTLARMVGNFVNIGETIEQQNEAAKKLSEQAMNEGWTQVGVNPSKHSYFYDRATGKPLKSADRVVQVGDLIYAENAKTTDIYDDQFIVKGKTDKAGKPLRFQKADIKLIAPNGKPSNLNQQQYDLVRTPAFKNWFGDWQNDPKNASKIVDENGEPMVVYHGTFNNFEAFDRSKGGTNTASVFAMPRNNWFWFSNNKDISSSYGSKILPVFLNVRNPQKAEGKKLNTAYKDALRLKKDGIIAEEVNDSRRTSQSLEVQTEDDVELISIDAKDFTGSLRSEIYGGTSIEEMIDLLESYIEYSKGEVAQYKEEYPQDVEYLETQMDQARRMIKAFNKYGRDGVKVGEPIKGDVFAIEKSNQAKLADGSNKTFDPQDERIRFQKADIEVSENQGRDVKSPIKLLDRQQVGSFEVNYVEQDRMADLIKEGLVTEPENLSEFANKYVAITAPDDMLAGQISFKGKPIFDGGGGVFFTTKYGDVWASGNEQTAETLKKIINESVKQNNGKGYLVLAKGTDAKLVSSVSGVESSLKILGVMLDENLISPSDFRRAVSDAVRKNGGSIKLRKSAKELQKDVTEYFNNPRTSTFDKRGNVVKDLIGNLAMSPSLKQNKNQIIDFLGADKSKGIGKTVTPKSQSLVDVIAQVAAEKVTKGLNVGDIYAVIEINGEVEVKEDSHPSYPYHVVSKTNSKPILHLPKTRQPGAEILTSSSGKPYGVDVVSVKSGTFNDASTMSEQLSEIADREQKSLIQIGRYYNANNQGFFPAQVNEFQLRRDLQAIGLDLKRAKNGAYYPTRNGRKVNIFPTPPSPYARFQRADIEITEPTVFNKKDTAEDIIRTARKKGYNDKSIRFYLLNRRKGEFKAKEVDALLKIDATLFDQLPKSFAEVEGGAIAGLKLYEKIDKFRQKLMDKNNAIKKPFLEEKQIQELVKEKNEELKKQGLSEAKRIIKLEAFEKRERANNKKRTKRLTLSEIMDKTIEFMEQQPEYKREADSYVEDGVTKYRKGVSTQQARMQAELQDTIGQKPTKEVAENIAKLKRNVRAWEKGQRDLQAIKNELKRLMRKHLPKEVYERKDVLKLIRAVSNATKENINVQIESVQEIIVEKTNKRLTNEALELLNIQTQKKESGKLKGVKVSNEVRKRLDAIKENVLDPKDLNFKDEIAITERNAELTRQFNELNQKVEKTQEDFQQMNDLQIAIGLNQAQLLEMNDSYRISPMETVVDSLDRLVMGGRGMFQLELEQAHAEYQRQFAELWEQITGQKLDMSDPDVQDKINETLKKEISREDKERMKRAFRRLLAKTYRLTGQGINNHEALFGLMDKINVMPGELAGGRIQEIVTQRVDEASIKYKGRMMEQEAIIEKKAQEIFGKGFKFFESSKWKRKMRQFQSLTDDVFTLDINNRKKPLSQNEMAYMYNQFKDPSLHPTFESMLGENYEQIMKELESKLDPQLKEWADWMVDEYFPSVYEHYNETYKKIYRTDMPFNENYAGRIFREGLDNNKPLDLLGNDSIYQTSVSPAQIKKRTDNKNNILPIDINNALLSYVQDMEYFAAYAEPMRDINKMFNNPNTSQFITNTYGKNVQELIQNQIEKISGKGTQNYKRAAIINYLNNSFIYAKIALSPVVFVKQLTSIFTYANDIGYVNWIRYGGSAALKTPLAMGKTWREITENSVYLKDRARGANIKRAIGNYYDSKNQLLGNDFLRASQQALLFTTKAGDKLAIMLGGMPNYLYYKDQYRKKNPKATEQEVIDYAIKRFEKDTKQTQQSSDLQDRDYYQTSDGFMRAMNMFLTTPKQYLRKEIIALRNLRRLMSGKAARGTAFENARQFFTYHFVMPMLFQWVASGFPLGDDWDEEDSSDMIRAAILGNLNGVFVLGDILGSFADFAQGKPWAADLNSIPLFIQVADVVKASQKLVQKINAKDRSPRKVREARLEFFGAMGGLFGLPVDQILKAKNNINKLKREKDVKKMLLRILNYSDYVIEGPEKEEKKKKEKKGAIEPLEALENKGLEPIKPLGYEEPEEEEKEELSPIEALIKGLTYRY